MTDQQVGARMRAIREELGLKQPEYAALLKATARRIKVPQRYGNTTISRLETGRQKVTLEDVLVIAATDPLKRGRDWLAWGNSTVSVAELPPHPETIVEDEAPIPVAQPAHHHHAAPPRRRARGQ